MRRLALVAVALLGLILGLGLWWAAPPRPPEDLADRPLPNPLPAGPLRITTFGTSLTASYDWPGRLQAMLTQCLNRPVTVTPVARSGAGIPWALTQVQTVAATDPDLVLVEFAINDADLRDGTRLAVANAAHQRLITELRHAAPNAQIALMTMNPAQGLRGAVRPYLAAHYLAYRDLAAEMETGLIDLYPRWLARPVAERGLQADGLHPTQDVAAKVIVPSVADYLSPDCSAAADP
jgi:lysophospholipase L1-like esterase